MLYLYVRLFIRSNGTFLHVCVVCLMSKLTKEDAIFGPEIILLETCGDSHCRIVPLLVARDGLVPRVLYLFVTLILSQHWLCWFIALVRSFSWSIDWSSFCPWSSQSCILHFASINSCNPKRKAVHWRFIPFARLGLLGIRVRAVEGCHVEQASSGCKIAVPTTKKNNKSMNDCCRQPRNGRRQQPIDQPIELQY